MSNDDDAKTVAIAVEVELHMARAFFASAWADQVEESDDGPNLSGKEIMDVMPAEIDPAALHAARTLRMDMERLNNLPLGWIFITACQVRIPRDGDRDLTPELFGHYCAMQAMGHGVGLWDSFGDKVYETIKVPYVEFGSHSLEKDYYPPKDEG